MSGSATASRLPVLALVGSSLIWGCTWIPLKYFADRGLAGTALLLLAYGPVALAALALLWRERRVMGASWAAGAAVLCFGGYANVAFNLSVMYGEVVRAMSLFYTLPLWAILGGMLFLGERLTWLRAAAGACALGGAWLILGGVDILARPPGWLDLLAVSSGFAYAMNNVVFRATPTLPVLPKIGLMYLGGALACLAVLAGGAQPWPATVPATLALGAVAFGACWLLLANLGTQWGVTHMEAGRAAVIIVLELVTAVITAMWLAGETLSAGEWCGAALILAAALLEARG